MPEAREFVDTAIEIRPRTGRVSQRPTTGRDGCRGVEGPEPDRERPGLRRDPARAARDDPSRILFGADAGCFQGAGGRVNKRSKPWGLPLKPSRAEEPVVGNLDHVRVARSIWGLVACRKQDLT